MSQGNFSGSARRLEDMSPDGALTLFLQDDGDVIVQVQSSDQGGRPRKIAAVEFCASGTRSRATRIGLQVALFSMLIDQEDRPEAGEVVQLDIPLHVLKERLRTFADLLCDIAEANRARQKEIADGRRARESRDAGGAGVPGGSGVD